MRGADASMRVSEQPGGDRCVLDARYAEAR